MFDSSFYRAMGYLKVFYDGEVTTVPLSEQTNMGNIKKRRFVTDGSLFRIGTLESLFDLSKNGKHLNLDPREELLVYKYERN